MSGVPAGGVLLAAVLVFGAYLLGSVSPGVLLVRRLRGRDPRSLGSGNAGATNVLRAAGPAPALLTLGLDVAKGAAPVLLARWLDGLDLLAAAAAVAVVLGHIFPLFFGFRGGKGVATALGAYLALAPLPVLASVAVFAAVVAWTRYVSLGSVLAVGLYPLALAWWSRGGSAPPPSEATAALVAASLMALLVVVAHRGNLRRLLAGTERRLGAPTPGPGEPSGDGVEGWTDERRARSRPRVEGPEGCREQEVSREMRS